jgi:hypothetical protein
VTDEQQPVPSDEPHDARDTAPTSPPTVPAAAGGDGSGVVATGADGAGASGAGGVQGRSLTVGQVAALNLRCLAVLAAGNLVLALVALAVGGDPGDEAGAALYILSLALLIAAGVVAVVGFPAGLLVARLLRGRPDRAHLVGFAAAGAVLAPALVALVGWRSAGILAAFAVEGLVGAGAAAAWTLHRLRVPRLPRVPRRVPDELIEDEEVARLRDAEGR